MRRDLARRLRELIAALDRRASRAEQPGEPAIARDAAALRERAVNRLADVVDHGTPASDAAPARVNSRETRTPMIPTAFPATPADVAALTVQEFTFDLDELDGDRVPSMERVCRTFMEDANRALVWWIRFGAFKAWSGRSDVAARLKSGSLTLRDACEAAAGFPLNDHWEFEPEGFRAAIEAVTAGRARAGSEP